MRLSRIALLAAFSIVAVPAASAKCMKADTEASAAGRLTIGKAKDAAGRPERPFILRLSKPACFDSADVEERVNATRTIHVFAANDAVQKSMKGLVGKAVQVRGKPFAPHTAHHHAPIVLEVAKIDAQ